MNTIKRRELFGTMSGISLGLTALPALSTMTAMAQEKPWTPISDRKIRVGIVGYGVCQFGAAFGFQDHPNVEVVAVSDLYPERRKALMAACRCDRSYDSLEELVRAPGIEAVFVATDAPNHAKHCIDALNHDKHVMTAVPAIFGSVDEAEPLIEAVKKSGLKYMMAETSCFRPDCYAMRQIYQAGGFGKLIYSEGEYYHYHTHPIDSFKGWRIGFPPLWYPTHSTAYYVGVTGKRFTSVSCVGTNAGFDAFKPSANRYNNPFSDEIALFQTSEGGSSRMLMSTGVYNLIAERGRVFGEKGWMDGVEYHGQMNPLPNITRPALPPNMPAGGHGGSHGLLTNEFISAILEDREPLINVYEALAMTVPGIVAHESAMKDGETLPVPQFDPSS